MSDISIYELNELSLNLASKEELPKYFKKFLQNGFCFVKYAK